MTETILVLDPLTPERAAKLRALLPPGFVLTHGTARATIISRRSSQTPTTPSRGRSASLATC